MEIRWRDDGDSMEIPGSSRLTPSPCSRALEPLKALGTTTNDLKTLPSSLRPRQAGSRPFQAGRGPGQAGWAHFQAFSDLLELAADHRKLTKIIKILETGLIWLDMS